MTDARIMQVPLPLLVPMAPHISPHLARGLEVAGRSAVEIAADIQRDHNQVWAIFEDGKVAGAFLTAIVVSDDGAQKSVEVFGMAGDGARRWGRAVSDRMADFAKANECTRVVCDGKPGWHRVFGSEVRVIGKKSDRVFIYERAV